MIFTDRKTETLRTAVATGRIAVPTGALEALKQKKVPKGDVLEAARTAAIMAAKKTFEVIPHCHPIPLDGISVDFAMEEGGVRVTVTVKAVWKTGVEMEALTGASVAMLTVYDMLKGLDPNLEIGSIRVVEKTGGKSDFSTALPKDMKAAVLVASDGVHGGKREDASGGLIADRLKSLGLEVVERAVVPDEIVAIRKKLLEFCEKKVHLVVTTGGTGLGPRDVTPEATQEVIERTIPGVAEAMRGFGQRRTPYAMLSRGIAGIRGKTLIVNLPGSAQGVEESMDAIFPALLHTYHVLNGGRH
ncbi:MAG: bifunctional molybdenum cofactor biosynthesis protein MoaC/MoaB [Pseudomonadota bacterium]